MSLITVLKKNRVVKYLFISAVIIWFKTNCINSKYELLTLVSVRCYWYVLIFLLAFTLTADREKSIMLCNLPRVSNDRYLNMHQQIAQFIVKLMPTYNENLNQVAFAKIEQVKININLIFLFLHKDWFMYGQSN